MGGRFLRCHGCSTGGVRGPFGKFHLCRSDLRPSSTGDGSEVGSRPYRLTLTGEYILPNILHNTVG